jgi:ABC-2 type transport system permease protein
LGLKAAGFAPRHGLFTPIATADRFPYNSDVNAATTERPIGAMILPALSLAHRELVRFLRQRNRVIGALATPIVFWLLIGAGMGRSFQGGSPANGSYLQYFYPGTILMILLFTAIFSTISIIEDRREGFLQSVLIAPISPMAIVIGKVLGGTALAFGQGLLFLALAPLIGFRFTPASFALALAVMFIVGFALTALGFCIAWRMASTQGFHAIMNLFLMPMWFLSGALFPPSGAMAGLGWVIRLNPLSYGLSALRQTMDPGTPGLASLPVSLAVSVGFAAVLFVIASVIAGGRTSSDLQ